MAKYTETLNKIMTGDFEDATEEEKREALEEVKKVCSIAAAAVAFQPFPLLDIALLSPIQIAMVQGIARIYGYRLDKRAVLEMLSTFGASILAQGAIMSAAKLIPFAGWLVAVAMAYALTYAIAEVSDVYFKSGRGASSEELKEVFQRVYKAKKSEKQSQHKKNKTLKDKLELLSKAHKSGLLDEDEFEKKKQDLLSNF